MISARAAEELLPGQELRVVTERRPVHLLSLLAQGGFEIETHDQGDEHETCIRRPAR